MPSRPIAAVTSVTETDIVITLYTFGPAFGLPDPSPFVMKVETLLKMAKLPYRTDQNGFSKAPKGKLPYIDDDGVVVADSTIIRWHLEKKYRIDSTIGLMPANARPRGHSRKWPRTICTGSAYPIAG